MCGNHWALVFSLSLILLQRGQQQTILMFFFLRGGVRAWILQRVELKEACPSEDLKDLGLFFGGESLVNTDSSSWYICGVLYSSLNLNKDNFLLKPDGFWLTCFPLYQYFLLLTDFWVTVLAHQHSVWCLSIFFSMLIYNCCVFSLCLYRKVDGPRAPRDERRRAQHNEGAWSPRLRIFQGCHIYHSFLTSSS